MPSCQIYYTASVKLLLQVRFAIGLGWEVVRACVQFSLEDASSQGSGGGRAIHRSNMRFGLRFN